MLVTVVGGTIVVIGVVILLLQFMYSAFVVLSQKTRLFFVPQNNSISFKESFTSAISLNIKTTLAFVLSLILYSLTTLVDHTQGPTLQYYLAGYGPGILYIISHFAITIHHFSQNINLRDSSYIQDTSTKIIIIILELTRFGILIYLYILAVVLTLMSTNGFYVP